MAGLPYNLRVNVAVPFPALVAGAAGIKVLKTNGMWTITPDFSSMVQGSPPLAQFSASFMQVWNSTTGLYSAVPLSTLITVATSVIYTLVIAAGAYIPLATDTVILINKTVPAANLVLLPPSVARNGAPLVIKDGKGDAALNNITIQPSGSELIDGLANLVINGNYGGYRLWPLLTGGWFIAP